MSTYGRELAALRTRTTTPDGRVEAKMRGDFDVRVRFVNDGHPGYAESELSAVLSRLLTDLMDQHRKGRARIADRAGLTCYDSETRPHWHKPTREFMAQRDATVVSGDSPNGVVRVATKGFRRFRVDIAPGAGNRLTGDELCRDLQSTVQRLGEDYRAVVFEMREAFHAIPGNANPSRG